MASLFLMFFLPIKVIADEVLTINCPENIYKVSTKGSCGAFVDFVLPEIFGGKGEVVLNQVKGPISGSLFPVGFNTVEFLAKDENGKTATCSFQIIVKDMEPPVNISCQEKILVEAEPGKKFAVVHYEYLVSSDNCSILHVTLKKGLPSGSNFPIGITEIELLSTDPSENTVICHFLIEVRPAGDTLLFLQCPSDKTIEVQENCEFMVGDYTSEVSTNLEADFTQDPPAGTLLSDQALVIIVAKSRDGQLKECTFILKPLDSLPPIISCSEYVNFSIGPEKNFVLPDLSYLLTTDDTCPVNIFQSPPIGTIITKSILVKLSVLDLYNNSAECSINVNLIKEDFVFLECPLNVSLQVNKNCSVEIPNFLEQFRTNSNRATVTQNPKAGIIISQDTILSITAILDNEVLICEFQISLEDKIPPEINCTTSELQIFLREGKTKIEPSDLNITFSDNCSANVHISPSFVTTTGNQEIKITAVDSSGNAVSCVVIAEVLEYPENICSISSHSIFIDSTFTAKSKTENLPKELIGDITLSKYLFDCTNLGVNSVDLLFKTKEGVDTCKIEILV